MTSLHIGRQCGEACHREGATGGIGIDLRKMEAEDCRCLGQVAQIYDVLIDLLIYLHVFKQESPVSGVYTCVKGFPRRRLRRSDLVLASSLAFWASRPRRADASQGIYGRSQAS